MHPCNSPGEKTFYPPLRSTLYVDVCLEDPVFRGKNTAYDKGHMISMKCMLPSAHCAGDKGTLVVSIMYNEGQKFPRMVGLPRILFNFLLLWLTCTTAHPCTHTFDQTGPSSTPAEIGPKDGT